MNYNFIFSDFYKQNSELSNNNIFNNNNLKEKNFIDKYKKKKYQNNSYYNPYDFQKYSNDKSDYSENKINAIIIRNNIESTIKDKSLISTINEFPISTFSFLLFEYT